MKNTKRLSKAEEEEIQECEWQIERLKRALPKANSIVSANVNETIGWFERRIKEIKDKHNI